MKKTYRYKQNRYFTQIQLVGYFMVLILIYGVVQFLRAPGLNIYVLVIAAAAYGAANTFIFRSNPNTVVVDDTTVSFGSPYGTSTYEIDQLEQFQIKEFPTNYQLFIRCRTKDGKNHSRHWVNYYFFNDSKDMIDEFYFLEKKCHPNALKFRGRPKLGMERPGPSPAMEGWVAPETTEAVPQEKPVEA